MEEEEKEDQEDDGGSGGDDGDLDRLFDEVIIVSLSSCVTQGPYFRTYGPYF